jgi:RNA polymerase sigma factor (sigma-70 family)
MFALETVPDAATAVSRRMARDEGLARFAASVRDLKDDERELVILCGLEGLTRREVAARMELREEAVTKRWQRLRTRLREQGIGAGVLTEE